MKESTTDRVIRFHSNGMLAGQRIELESILSMTRSGLFTAKELNDHYTKRLNELESEKQWKETKIPA